MTDRGLGLCRRGCKSRGIRLAAVSGRLFAAVVFAENLVALRCVYVFLALTETAKMSPRFNRLVTAAYDPTDHSDRAVAQRVLERLRNSSFIAIRRLTCDVHESMLTLRGRVPNFYTKQMVLSLIADVEGVEEITDRIEVA